jgi:hypothetical protein
MKDRSGRDRGLTPADRTLPTTAAQPPASPPRAPRATKPVRPAQLLEVVQAGSLIGEPLQQLRIRARVVLPCLRHFASLPELDTPFRLTVQPAGQGERACPPPPARRAGRRCSQPRPPPPPSWEHTFAMASDGSAITRSPRHAVARALTHQASPTSIRAPRILTPHRRPACRPPTAVANRSGRRLDWVGSESCLDPERLCLLPTSS